MLNRSNTTVTDSNREEVSNERQAEPPLPLLTKLSYGAPSFAGAAMAIPIGIHLTIFYSDTILVPLGFIALVKAVARSLDAITDPIMGWLSDRTKTRWGRRRPWIVIGAPLTSICFYYMFTPPELLSGVDAAAWFAVTYTLYYLFHTVYIIPHYGLGPELTLDYHERSTLFGIREGFVVAGTFTAAILPPILISIFGGERPAYTSFAVIFGCLLSLLYFNLAWRVTERPEFSRRESNPLIPGVRRVMRNHVFKLLLTVYLVGSITGAIPGLMMPYFTKYVLQPENPNLWLAVFLAIYFGSGFLSLPIWVWASRKFEKKPVWLAGFVPGITGALLLFTLGEGDLLQAAVILVISGSGFSAGLFLGPSMQADVIDYDELHTGKRREAQFGALWSIMTKFMVIPSMSVPLAILASVGYVPNVEQSESVQLTIRLIFCFGPATTATFALLIGFFYPIDKQTHERIQKGIEDHRSGQDVVDPITGHLLKPPSMRGVDEADGWQLDHFSLGELGRFVERGSGIVKIEIALLSLASLVSVIVFLKLLLGEVDFETEPGLLAVSYVVVLGLSITSFAFHCVRLWQSFSLEKFDRQVVRDHIQVTREMQYGSQRTSA